MKYKQCLLFIAKCLTLDQHPERIAEIEQEIRTNRVDWEDVVKLSSRQFVLPAIYLQLKRNGLLPYWPDDLIEHVDEITNLNRARNKAILEQTGEITETLQKNNITPVFIKGVAHLLAGIYFDNAERMVGDIDLIVPEEKVMEAASLFMEEGYKPLHPCTPEFYYRCKHYPKLQNYNYPAAVEVHKELLKLRHQELFRGYELLKGKEPVAECHNRAFIPSTQHMIIHNVLNARINDYGSIYNSYGNILLRQMYDLRMLSLRADNLEAARGFGKKFNLLNTYYAIVSYVFSRPREINLKKTLQTKFHTYKLALFLYLRTDRSFFRKMIFICTRIYRYTTIPVFSIFNKGIRKRLYSRLSDRKWYGKHIRLYADFFKKRRKS